MADSLREIRKELSALKDRMDGPTHRQQLAKRAQGMKEHPDPTPVEIPGGRDAPDTIQELIKRYVRTELSAQASDQSLGTFEEEDDFTEDATDQLPFSEFEIPDSEPDLDMPDVGDLDPSQADTSPPSDPPPVDGEPEGDPPAPPGAPPVASPPSQSPP